MKDNFEALVPGLAEQRAKERENRDHAFAGLTHTLCGVELLAMTPRHRLTLQILRNCFVGSTADPLDGDVFIFLWVLSPHYSQRLTPLSRLRQFFLRRRARRVKLPVAAAEIRDYIVAQFQDLPEGRTDEGGAEDVSPWVHWAATDASWWMNIHGGFTLESYFSTPYGILQQLYRGWKVNNPPVSVDERGNVTIDHPQFINESDRLVGRFHRGFREEIAAAHRENLYRRLDP